MGGTGPGDRWPPLSAAKLSSARRLITTHGRREGLCLVEGAQCVREALRFVDVRLVIVTPTATAEAEALAVQADAVGLPVAVTTAQQARQLTSTVASQGVLAVCAPPSADLGSIVTPRLVLVLDEVRDPGNVGTLIRTADAFGASAVIATSGTADVWGSKATRSSVGSVFHLPIVTGVELPQVVEWARGVGLRLLGADTAGRWLDDVDLASPTAWLFGNEAHGLPEPHLAQCSERVAIPMWGRAESLNVATAAGICLYATALAQNHS